MLYSSDKLFYLLLKSSSSFRNVFEKKYTHKKFEHENVFRPNH